MSPLAWLRTHDPGLAALRRAARTAIIMPGLFALSIEVIRNAELATFAAFGTFAMLLFVDFSGPLKHRLEAHLALGVSGAVLVCLGTLASHNAIVAAVAMTAIGLVVLFVGVISSVLAGARTSLLIGFILPVTTPAPTSAIPDRLAGWALATGAALVAVAVLWPSTGPDRLRGSATAVCRVLSDLLRAQTVDAHGDAAGGNNTGFTARATEAVAALERIFFATPYRPTGLTSAARAQVRLVDELGWLARIAQHARPVATEASERQVHTVILAVADLLSAGAALLEAPSGRGGDLSGELAGLRAALHDMKYRATGSIPIAIRDSPDRAQAVVSSLEPLFRAQELSYAASVVAANIERVVSAEQRTWWARVRGHQPDGINGPLASAHERAGAHVEWHSVWLHNSVRGAVALGAAVLVADLTGVQHSFWVVLGTLAVLRSSALSTGQNSVRGILGTAAGVVVGGLVVAVVGPDTTLLWLLLPAAVLLAGLAPTTLSFTAGQGAFTLTLVILYNIIAPVGWKVGLTRVEDIAIGCTVSVAMGAMFWPRGAGRALGRALAEAYTDSAANLRSAVFYGLRRCIPSAQAMVEPTAEAYAAAASARRLDDTFRGYLAERGTKPVPLAEITALVTGVAGLRLAADAVLNLWTSDAAKFTNRAAPVPELAAAVDAVAGWYDTLAAALAGGGAVPPPQEPATAANQLLVAAIRDDLTDPESYGTATAVRLVWTADHVDAARRLQALLSPPAHAVVAARRRATMSRLRALRIPRLPRKRDGAASGAT